MYNDQIILAILNSETGRFLLGITEDFPIVRYSHSWVEMWTGKYKDGLPLLQAVVWTYPHVEEKVLIPYTQVSIAQEICSLNPTRALLHYAGIEHTKGLPIVLLDTTTKNPGTGEGWIQKSGGGSWSTARGASTGDSTDARGGHTSTNAAGYTIRRAFLPFDTSALGTIVVTAASVQIYRDDSIDVFSNADGTSTELVPSQEASGTSLATSDYNKVTFTSRASKAFSTTSNGAYQTLTISDFTEITGIVYTKYAIITGMDLNNSTPIGENSWYWQNRAGANPPKLNITYTIAAGGFFNYF